MIDNIDWKIIIALSRDGRYSYARLARELDINIVTLTKRVNIMLEEGVISIRAIRCFMSIRGTHEA